MTPSIGSAASLATSPDPSARAQHAGRFHDTPPEREAALARIAAIRPADYARTRNHLEGAVTGLSPYITHGLVTLPEVLAGVLARGPLPVQHKLVQELGWREFFRHAWAQTGEGIFTSRHPGPLPESAYAQVMPTDVLASQTGVPAIDQAVHTLRTTGLLHNHARMWLASYLVHLRHVHWRVGADWMVGRLLDGDLASNHLSWQWVAGTGSHKPYLFNAENVARFAPSAWHSAGTVIDQSYEALEEVARGRAGDRRLGTVKVQGVPIAPDGPHATVTGARGRTGATGPTLDSDDLLPSPPAGLGIEDRTDTPASDLSWFQGREVWLVHPWALRAPPADVPADAIVLGIYLREHHARWPWTERRWHWVDAAMAQVTPRRWFVDAARLPALLAGAQRVRSVDDPHITRWLQAVATLDPAPALFPRIDRPCSSFSQWWTRASRGLRHAGELLE